MRYIFNPPDRLPADKDGLVFAQDGIEAEIARERLHAYDAQRQREGTDPDEARKRRIASLEKLRARVVEARKRLVPSITVINGVARGRDFAVVEIPVRTIPPVFPAPPSLTFRCASKPSKRSTWEHTGFAASCGAVRLPEGVFAVERAGETGDYRVGAPGEAWKVDLSDAIDVALDPALDWLRPISDALQFAIGRVIMWRVRSQHGQLYADRESEAWVDQPVPRVAEGKFFKLPPVGQPLRYAPAANCLISGVGAGALISCALDVGVE